MFGYGQESPGKPRIKKSHAYLSCLRTSAYLFPRKSISHDFCRAMFLTQREIKVQASCSSCLGQLFSKIFNFFCVPLTLPVWLLNAWVCACLDMVRNHQGNRTQKRAMHICHVCAYQHIYFLANLYPTTFAVQCFSHNEKSKVQASCSSCLGQLLSKIFNFFCVPLTLPVWLLNAWVCACLDMARNHQGNRT